MSAVISSSAAIAPSDNSSDSASNNKKTTSSHKSELEIVDQKIIKCINEINYLKQKIQREWSKQMNNHLKSFYSDDFNNGDSSLNSSNNTSALNTTTNNNSTPQQQSTSDSGEYEKKINLLTKKLRSYEKRRQKLVYENKKNNQENTLSTTNSNNISTSTASSDTPVKLNDANNNTNNGGSSKNGSTNGINTIGNGSNNITLNESNINNNPIINLTPIQASNQNASNISSLQAPGKIFTRNNGSFINTNGRLFTNAKENTNNNNNPVDDSKSNNLDDKQSALFYLNSENIASNVKLPNDANADLLNNNNNNDDLLNNSTNTNSSMINNKTSFDRNMIFLQMEQQIYYFKLQQDKMQSDLEEIQKKIIDNQQILMKELQHTCNQISEPVHKLSFNLYKSYDQKLDDLKSSFERSIQSFNYNLTHIHRDIKETKEDVTYMKNRIEILEKSQKTHNIDANPTNYYQLFYKLLDILLTLATIILLAFTNMIASIKFIFLLYPRTIVIMLFIYLIFFYLVDFDKLDVYFHRILLNDPTFSSKFKLKSNATSSLLNNSNGKSNLTYLSKLIQSVYGLVFQYKSKSSSSSSSPSSSSSS